MLILSSKSGLLFWLVGLSIHVGLFGDVSLYELCYWWLFLCVLFMVLLVLCVFLLYWVYDRWFYILPMFFFIRPKMSQQEEIISVHGVPLTFQEVDRRDMERRQGWIDYLTESDAVRRAAPRMEKMHIGTLAHFYFRDAEIPFKCKAHDRTTTIIRCEACPDWFRPDNICQVDGMGAYLETQPPIKDIALDTMHILRVTLRGKRA